jgi:hypothetical protein
MHHDRVDGLLYQSAVYTVTGSISGCNIVLYEGRSKQVKAISHQPITAAVLKNG